MKTAGSVVSIREESSLDTVRLLSDTLKLRTDAPRELYNLTDSVAEVVRRCPSGALQYRLHHGEPMSPPTDTSNTPEVRIEFIPDGPVRITGGVTLMKEDGAAERQERVFLCRCGGSARKPFCDGTHKKNGFRSGG